MVSIEKIVSGGQSGADRAALDWAIDRGLPHEGWCPAGRRAEDGVIDSRYSLRETPQTGYITRTRWNVRDADATVIFSLAEYLSGGSMATLKIARNLGKPVVHHSKAVTEDPARKLLEFVEENFVAILNVAGPRASGEESIGEFVYDVLEEAFAE
jgi:hypothetical protein